MLSFIGALKAIHRLGDAGWTEDGIDLGSTTNLRAVFDRWADELRDTTS